MANNTHGSPRYDAMERLLPHAPVIDSAQLLEFRGRILN